VRYVKLLLVVALVGSIGWVIAEPGFEPGLAVVASISALISESLIEKRNTRRAQQYQSVSKSSVGVQAGRDITIKHIGSNKHVE